MDLLDFLKSLLSADGIYLTLFGSLLICGIGLPIPEEALFIAAGIAGKKVGASPWLLCVAGLLGIMAGDSIPYFVGRHFGLNVVKKSGWRKLFPAKVQEAVQGYFARRGAKTVFLARFIAGLRTPAFLIAGASGMKYATFFAWDFLGAVLSCPISIWIAFLYGDRATELIGRSHPYIFIALVLIFIGGFWKWHSGPRHHGDAKSSILKRLFLKAFYYTCRAIMYVPLKLLFRFTVTGAQRIPAEGPVVLIANHASFIDPIFVACSTRRCVRFLMYKSFYYSWANPLFRLFRTIPLDERDYVVALKAGVRALREGACVGIFPEGAVSYDGLLLPAKEGALFVAQRGGAPVIPIAIRGNHDALPRGAWFPRPRKVDVFIGEPIHLAASMTRAELSEELKRIMASLAQRIATEIPVQQAPAFQGRERDCPQN